MRAWYAKLYGAGESESTVPENWVTVTAAEISKTKSASGIRVDIGGVSLCLERDFDEEAFVKVCRALQQLC